MLRISRVSTRLRTVVIPLLVAAAGTSSLLGCVSEPKKDKPKAAAKTPKNLVLDAVPGDVKKLDVDFDGKISLVGYKLDAKRGLKPGDKVNYTLYWKSEKPLEDKGFRLFTHVFDGTKKRLLNIDKVGGLRQSELIPSNWTPGKVYVDEQTFTVPKNAAGNKLQVVTGFFKDASRLKIVKGTQLGADGALALTVPLDGAAASPAWRPQTLRVDRLEKSATITIDGKLTEPAWETAAKTSAFVNVGSGKFDPKQPVQGKVRLLWDNKALYAAFEVTDKDVVGGFDKAAKDPHLWTKDTVEIMVDPDGDGDNKDYYEIQVNPQNLVFDSRFDDYNLPKGGPEGPFGNQEWSAKLRSAVVVDGTLDQSGDEDKGYVVELSIPWTSFDKAKRTPPELGDTWRFNFYAMQNNGGVAWSPIMGKGNFHKASQFGRILFAEKGWSPAAAPSATGSASATAAVGTAPKPPATSATTPRTPVVNPATKPAPANTGTAKPAGSAKP